MSRRKSFYLCETWGGTDDGAAVDGLEYSVTNLKNVNLMTAMEAHCVSVSLT